MPGILPMKVIKVGSSAQSRIAQACDRCRSKKIRCDGIRPCCSQCASVGFECKTSDKLSRRAFPRGYTESLEERVRSLELEVRELKDLLDSKDEKIDMLSRLHSRSSFGGSQSRRGSSAISSASPDPAQQGHDLSGQPSRLDTFCVNRRPSSDADGNQGEAASAQRMSSTRSFIECFKGKLQEQGKPILDFDVDAFLYSSPKSKPALARKNSASNDWSIPPRLECDQMINVYFQEWAPLFPILHRPTFLSLYDSVMADKGAVEDKYFRAQMNLVFCIAASHDEDASIVHQCEAQFVKTVEEFSKEVSLENLQCLTLATLYCLGKGDRARLIKYRTLATDIAKQFDLHKRVSGCNALTGEMRKRTFWTLYTLDNFAAACLGNSRAFKNTNIDCDYPSDVDDEYVTEDGFESSPPGEATKLSSALASFRVARILAQVLDQNYPSACNYELSLQGLQQLSEELDDWLRDLPQPLRLEFEQDKPSTKVINDRCPLLSLTYYYVRSLIYRPAVFSDLGDKSSAAMVKLSAASKRIVQILQLLQERKLALSHCFDQNELLLMSGFGLMLQTLDLEDGSKMKKESQCMICVIIEMLTRAKAAGANEFKRLGCSMVSVRTAREQDRSESLDSGLNVRSTASRSTNDIAPMSFNKPCTNGIQDMVRRYTIATGKEQIQTNVRQQQSSHSDLSSSNGPVERTKRRSRLSVISASSEASPTRSLHGYTADRESVPPQKNRAGKQLNVKTENSMSPPTRKQAIQPNDGSPSSSSLNLDFFTFPSESPSAGSPAAHQHVQSRTPIPNSQRSNSNAQSERPDWESLLKTFGQTNLDNAGAPFGAIADTPASSHDNEHNPNGTPATSHAAPHMDDNHDFLAYLNDLTTPPDSTSLDVGSATAFPGTGVNPSEGGQDLSQNLLVSNASATGKQKIAKNMTEDGMIKPKSVLSLSDESLTSGEEFSSIDFGSDGDNALFDNLLSPLTTVTTADANYGIAEGANLDQPKPASLAET